MATARSWTRQDENQAFLQGWNIFRGLIGHEKDIIRIRSDSDAVDFVTRQATVDLLAKKALYIHRETLARQARAKERKIAIN